MRHFLLAVAWALAILLSHIGWGRALRGIARMRLLDGWGIDAAVGVGVTIAIGGVLNEFHLITAGNVIVLTLCGAAIAMSYSLPRIGDIRAAAGGLWRDRVRNRLLLAGVIVLIAIAAARFGGTLVNNEFQKTDDLWAYLAFPVKMLQTGSFGLDPFSERRLVSSLGGNTFLQAQVLCVLDLRSLNIADAGIGFLMMLGVLGAIGHEMNLGSGRTLLVLILAALMPPIRINLTSTVLPAALLCALVLMLWRRTGGQAARGTASSIVGVALVAAALWSLKSTLIPITAFCVIAFAFFDAIGRRSASPIGAALACGVIALLVLSPWMHSMKQSSGTWLYPILGNGDHTPAADPHQQLLLRNLAPAGLLAMALLACSAIVAIFRRFDPSGWPSAIAVYLVAAGLSIAAVGYASGGYAWLRYSFPATWTALMLILCLLLDLHRRGEPARSRPLGAIGAAALAAGVLAACCRWYSPPAGAITFLRKSVASIAFGIRNVRMDSADILKRMTALQNSMPPGAKLLERLTRPYLLDFQRNDVLICDWPGMCSPPPGMPVESGAEALAEYLTNHSIRYVAYSYADRCALPPEALAWAKTDTYGWLRLELNRALRVQELFVDLSKTRRVVYDDGENFVLDLGSRIIVAE